MSSFLLQVIHLFTYGPNRSVIGKQQPAAEHLSSPNGQESAFKPVDMAWVREKNPKRKVSATQRDPKEALEGFLSYLACKPAPAINVQRYLRDISSHKHDKPEIVPREPTLYDEEESQKGKEEEEAYKEEEQFEVASLRSQRTRSHHHYHVSRDNSPPPRRTPAPRYVSSVEPRPYRPKTTVQTRRVVSSWSNATTPLVI